MPWITVGNADTQPWAVEVRGRAMDYELLRWRRRGYWAASSTDYLEWGGFWPPPLTDDRLHGALAESVAPIMRPRRGVRP